MEMRPRKLTKRRMSRKLLLIIVLVVAAAGLAYLISGPVCVPDLAQFEVTGELTKTEYGTYAQVTVEPFLTYTGMRGRVTIFSGTPLFYVDVYTADGAQVIELPVLEFRYNIGLLYTLTRNVPYNDKDVWTHWYGPGYSSAYRFSLERPGDYKVMVRAHFSPNRDDPARPSRVYSEPIWITITG
jgi:hypothetical protein